MKNKTPDDRDWQAIRRQCEAGEQTVASIARAHGLSASYLYSKRSKWKAEQTVNSKQSDEVAPSDHRAMVKRLYHATDRQIRHLETQLENGNAAFDEKEARMLGTIARTLDKIMELTPQDQTQKRSSPASKQAAPKEQGLDETGNDRPNLDALRQELALRLDRLQQGTKGKLSGDSERA